jgi:3',5'-nucleoside bisphosphate phosphatase
MKKFICLVQFICAFTIVVSAQESTHSHALGTSLQFPNIMGYQTLKCDLHQHTVFSDGDVWPSIRVRESLMDNLDAISLTEHLEYQPHLGDIPNKDRNRSYQIALKEAKDHNLVIIRGSEITRAMPPGHSNAVFIQDANKLLFTNFLDAYKEAKNQNAFVFWNHPYETPKNDYISFLNEVNKKLIDSNLIQGIEVVNTHNYSAEALQIAYDRNLTLMGTSDIHGLIEWDYKKGPKGTEGHRPITLVFSKDRTQESIKSALFDRRTVVHYDNTLIGRDSLLIPLINECLVIKRSFYEPKSLVLTVVLENVSSCNFILQNLSQYTLVENTDLIEIEGKSTITLQFKTKEILKQLDWSFNVLNAVNAPNSHPIVKKRIIL